MALALGLFLPACGAGPVASAPADLGVSAPADAPVASLDLLDAITPTHCAPDPDGVDGGACLDHVEATIVDEAGGAVGGLLVSVCGASCFFGTTTADGHVSVPIATVLRAADYTLCMHARPSRAGYYAQLPAPVAGVARFSSKLPLPTLPTDGPTLALDGKSPQSLSSGDITVSLPAGAIVNLDVEDVVDANTLPRFRVAAPSPTLTAALPFVAGASPAPDALYALTPYEAEITGPGATVRIANTHAFPAGAVLTVATLGSLLDPSGPPAGVLAPIGTAHVSADGMRIDLDAPLHFFSWIALSLAQKGP